MIKRTAPDFLKKIVYVLVTPFAILLALLLSDYVFGTNIYSEENNLMVYYVYSMVMKKEYGWYLFYVTTTITLALMLVL